MCVDANTCVDAIVLQRFEERRHCCAPIIALTWKATTVQVDFSGLSRAQELDDYEVRVSLPELMAPPRPLRGVLLGGMFGGIRQCKTLQQKFRLVVAIRWIFAIRDGSGADVCSLGSMCRCCTPAHPPVPLGLQLIAVPSPTSARRPQSPERRACLPRAGGADRHVGAQRAVAEPFAAAETARSPARPR